MVGPLIIRAIRIIIIISLVLFTARLIWNTTDNNNITVAGQQQQETQTSNSRELGIRRSTPLTSNDQKDFLHLIIQFPVLLNDFNSLQLQQRQFEYIQTLQNNLGHPLIREVHILCENDHEMKFIEKHFTQNAEKIVLTNIGRRMRYSDALSYASTVLLFYTCIIMNADCYIGNGFEHLNTRILKQGTIYALTRHENVKQIASCGVRDFCGVHSKYIGSHDAFVMSLVRPLSDVVLRRLDFRPNIAGAENVAIFVLKKYGHFRLKNPCHILHVIHNHCNTKRNNRLVNGQRLEKYLKLPKGLATFSGL